MNEQNHHIDTSWINRTIEPMSLAQKAGQVLFVNLNPVLNDTERIIEDIQPGGIVALPYDVDELPAALNEVQKLSHVPLLVGASYERGVGTFTHGATDLPSAMGLSASRNPEHARIAGRIVGREARALGVHCVYAPVCDLNTDPLNPIINVRSFGEDPHLTFRMAQAWLEGAQESPVVCTIKHFPGQGQTGVDTHTSLACIEGAKEELFRKELLPFFTLLDTGVPRALMTAHVWASGLDSVRRPATLSPYIVHDMLKQRYTIAVFTDAMDMGGIREEFGGDEAVIDALEAGCDMIVMPGNHFKARDLIVEAVESGKLSSQRLEDAVHNVLRIKAFAGLDKAQTVDSRSAELHVGTHQNKQMAYNIACQTLTLIKNHDNILPLQPDTRIAVIGMVNKKGQTMLWRDNYNFGRKMRRSFPNSRSLFLGEKVTAGGARHALQAVHDADVCVLALYPRIIIGGGEIRFSPEQLELLQRIVRTGIPTIGVSFCSPYIFNDIPTMDACVCAYSNADAVQRATVDLLRGALQPYGKLPVSINPEWRFGYGVSYTSP